MGERKQKDERARIWACVVYPESAPKDWKEKLNDLKIKWACSPLHDKDKDDNDKIKKAHWHLILQFEGKKSKEQIKKICDEILKSPMGEVIHSRVGAVRYFVHLDNPEKHQYNISDIESHFGFDIQTPFEDDAMRSKNFNDIVQVIMENKIDNIIELRYVLQNQNRKDLIDFIETKNSYMVINYVKAQKYLNEKFSNQNFRLDVLKAKSKKFKKEKDNDDDWESNQTTLF